MKVEEGTFSGVALPWVVQTPQPLGEVPAPSEVTGEAMMYSGIEFVVVLTLVIVILAVIAMLQLYGGDFVRRLWHRMFPHRVTGLFLRVDVIFSEPRGGEPLKVISGYITTLSEKKVTFITDERIPVGGEVVLDLNTLPPSGREIRRISGTVKRSRLHALRSSFYENKVKISAVEDELKQFEELLENLETNYSAA